MITIKDKQLSLLNQKTFKHRKANCKEWCVKFKKIKQKTAEKETRLGKIWICGEKLEMIWV